jgi:hypothetical protein
MQRLAALVPRPRLHLIRFHGVLAPNAKLRPMVVPKAPEVALQATEAAATAGCEAETVQARPHPVARSARQVQLPTTASRQAIFAVGCRLGVVHDHPVSDAVRRLCGIDLSFAGRQYQACSPEQLSV